MIINTLYKTDTLIDGIKYNPPSEINNYEYAIVLQWKNENGKLHNENGPAVIGYNENGNISYKLWYINGKLHNDNGPARIAYYKNGNVKYKEWYVNDKCHNDNGPAYIRYYKNGNITEQQYWKNGIRIK